MADSPDLSPREGRRFMAAIAVVFMASGGALASWLPRIPETRARLDLTYDELGLALFGAGAGAMLFMPITGWLIGRHGSYGITRGTAVGMAATLPLIALAPNLTTLAAALAVFGAFTGSLDVAMNAQAAHGEGRTGRRFLSIMHGMWSVGTMAAAGIAALAVKTGVPLTLHIALVGAFLVGAVIIAGFLLLPDKPGTDGPIAPFALPTGAIWWLGIIAFCALLSEGTIYDWSAVFLRDALSAAEEVAALGFGAFTVTMTLGRLAGDHVVDRFGAVGVLRSCGGIALIGIVLVLTTPSPPLAIVGFALCGIGISAVFPIVVRAAARSRDMPPGAAIAAVSTAGYTAFLAGPPLIGMVSQATSLHFGMGIVVVLTLAIVLLAVQGRSADRDR